MADGAVVSSEARLGQAVFPGSSAYWQNSVPFSPLDWRPSFLLVVGERPPSLSF